MSLIIISIITGFIGLNIGGLFGTPIGNVSGGIIGVLAPGLYVLEQIRKELKK